MNPGGVRRVAFMRSFRVISQAGAKDTVATLMQKSEFCTIRYANFVCRAPGL